ncbi:MAG: pectinesterase family protein [Clostridiales bacterium]|nr:pectinesterase family protein [Clostridiales bacterium]
MTKFKKDGFKRIVSLILSVLMVLSAVQATVFAETTETHGYWTITNADDSSSGTAVMYADGVAFTYHSATTHIIPNGSTGNYYGIRSNNCNGGVSSGGIVTTEGKSYTDYTPAADGTLTVRVANASTKTGYVSRTSLSDGTSEALGSFVPGGTDDYDTDSMVVTQGSYTTLEIEAETGYTYYITVSGSKMTSYGGEFVPYTTLSGTINDSFGLGEYGLKFTNKTTGSVTYADVEGTSYSVVLKPGYDYSAGLSGSNATAYAISSDSRTVSVTATDTHTQTADLTIEESVSYFAEGSLTGFSEGYDLSDLVLTFTPSDLTSFEAVKATIDTTALTYSAQLCANETYTLSMDGAYDYELSTSYSSYSENADNIEMDIAFTAAAKYAVSGGFIGLTQVRGEYEDLSVTPTAVTFKNVDDGYTYSGTAADAAYSVSLRDGSYLASITAEGYSTTTHVVVNGAAVEKDLLLKDETAKSVDYSETLYVGSSRDYKTISAAVESVSNMTRENSERVTIEIDPGTYREQVYIATPNITLKGTGSSRDETKITWYYGIGYNYYSCSNGYYSPYADYDKFEKSEPARWGTAVITQSAATGFKAENITFENSFNKYMTDEEISDGVEVSGSSGITVVRKETTNVDDRASTERAAAYVNYADQVEFYNCAFIGSQDTLYTCNQAYDSYYRSCYIEGQTDFIYGDGNVIFDGCEINFCGYDGTEASGYITAQSASTTSNTEYGYIFKSCYVSYNSERDTTAGTYGRLWGDSARVTFINTQLQEADMITDIGWTTMGNNNPDTSETACLTEYNTTHNGEAIDTSGRAAKANVLTEIDLSAYSVENVFTANGWTPSYYVTDTTDTAPAFSTAPNLSSNGDLNKPNPGETVTVNYEIDQNGDASRISWYGVSYDGDDITSESLDTLLNSAALLYTSSAVSTNKYQISMDCAGLYLLVVVTPITNYGLEGDPGYVLVYENAVSDTWSDPDNPDSIAPGSGINIYLAGDSTVKDYSAKGMYNSGQILSAGSWGEFLQEFFDEDYVQVNDYAQGGRSCRSFLNEGKLAEIMENIKEGDYLLMQFGHNDSASGESYYADRFVPLYTQDSLPTSDDRSSGFPTIKPTEAVDGSYYYTWDCGATYKGFLQEYIDETLEKGAIPVIVSPVARMYYDSSGKIRTHHDAGSDYELTKDYYTTNNAYVTACEELYEKNKDKGVLYIDAFGFTVEMFEDAYAECGSDDYGYAIMDDATHSNKTGGMIQAGKIAKWMQDANISLSSYVEQPVTVYGEETSGDYIFTVINKVFTAKNKSLVEYPYWSAFGQELFDSIGGSSSVVNIDLDFSTDEAMALYTDSSSYTEGVYSGKYTNDSSQTFNVSVYESGIAYANDTADYGTRVSKNTPVFSFTVSDASSYTVTFDPSVSDATTVGLYKDSSCSEAAATAALTDGSVTYNKTTSGEETLYFSSADATNLYIKSFTISSEDLPENTVTLAFNTTAAFGLYVTNADSTFTNGEYSGVYTNDDGQSFEAAVYSSGIKYFGTNESYGTMMTAGKPLFSFVADSAGIYTVTAATSQTGTGTINMYSDSSCTTSLAEAADPNSTYAYTLTYTKTDDTPETIYVAASESSNMYAKEFTVSSKDLTVISLVFNTAEVYELYHTNKDTTFDENGYYSGVYTNSNGQSFEVSVIESGFYYPWSYGWGAYLLTSKAFVAVTLTEAGAYTFKAPSTYNSGTISLYSDEALTTSLASSSISTSAAGEFTYKKTSDGTETVYFAAVGNPCISYVTITQAELAADIPVNCTGTVTGIESDDTNVIITLKSSTDTVTVDADEYAASGVELNAYDTYTVSAIGDKGVYTGTDITPDESGEVNIVLSRIEFAFPLDFVNNFDAYSTYLTAKGYGSSDITDPYSGITIHGSGIVLTERLKTYGAKTNSNKIISFTAETTGKVTVTVDVTASNSDTLQLLIDGTAATDEVSASGTATLSAYVVKGDTVTLYTPTRSNLYFSDIIVNYREASKAVKTINSIRYIIFGIDEDDVEGASSFNIVQGNDKAADSEGNAVDFDTVYEAVEFDDSTTMTAEEILGAGAKYVVAFMLDDEDADTSDTTILDGFSLSFNQ